MLATPEAIGALTQELRPPLGAVEAVFEADRCLECGGPHAPAPCVIACPADVDVPGFVAAVADGATEAAAATIFSENLLGGTCARVCPVELLCEGACVLQRPIAIGALQRFATDAAFERGLQVREPAAVNGRWVAVVGAEPAGLACAGELAALTDCPLGWGHEPRISHRIVDAAVESRFWPLYGVADGRYRLTFVPERPLAIEDWLAGQARFAHLLGRENTDLVAQIQAQVDADWQALVERCS